MIEQFQPKHSHIVCVDSDGTAMDTMTIKHEQCFGPCFADEWGLQPRAAVLKRWNEINLYEKTRGKNRFITLLQILKEWNVGGIGELEAWVRSGAELSNDGLKRAIATTPSEILQKALVWSENTNRAIAALRIGDKKPFGGVEEFFRYAQGKTDIAVVSSANAAAIGEEWGHYGLLGCVDVVTSQEIGTKKDCITRLIERGYERQNVVLLGDALSDKKAADDCGVYFYPIFVKREKESWDLFRERYLDEFLNGNFAKSAKSLSERFIDQFEN